MAAARNVIANTVCTFVLAAAASWRRERSGSRPMPLSSQCWPGRAHRDCLVLQFTATAVVYAGAKLPLSRGAAPLLSFATAMVAAAVAFVASVAVSGDLRHSVVSFVRRAYCTRAVLAR